MVYQIINGWVALFECPSGMGYYWPMGDFTRGTPTLLLRMAEVDRGEGREVLSVVSDELKDRGEIPH